MAIKIKFPCSPDISVHRVRKYAMLQAKQGKMEEMTPGQASTLARNEQVIDTATDNLEELEEELNSSIAETLKGKKRNKPETHTTRHVSASYGLDSTPESKNEESLPC